METNQADAVLPWRIEGSSGFKGFRVAVRDSFFGRGFEML